MSAPKNAVTIHTAAGELTAAERETIRGYLSASLSANTMRAYAAARRDFESFCAGIGAQSLPADPVTVVRYLRALDERGQKSATITLKVAAVAYWHTRSKLADPTKSAEVAAVLAGLRRQLADAGRARPTRKAPVTRAELAAMHAAAGDDLRGLRDRAMMLLGFAGAFRRSELAALDVADMRFDSRKLAVTVRRSKTDQYGAGLTKNIVRLLGDPLCAVAALRAWLDAARIESGPVFRRIDKWGVIHPGALDARSVALTVKRLARAAGLDWRTMSGHSLRAGFVTAAAQHGAEALDIAEVTGHRNLNTLRGYVRDSAGVAAARAVRAAFDDSGGL